MRVGMKGWLLALLCMMSVLGLSAQKTEPTNDPVVTLRMRDASLTEVLEEIGRQAEVTFSYESSLLKGLPKISFQADNLKLGDCLEKLFASFPVTCKRSGNVVILKRRQRQVTISGFVRDETSLESLIGAAILVKGGPRGTASNSYGFFSLTVPPGDNYLHISYIGYKGKSLYFPGLARDTIVEIGLRANVRLEEVVVTANGQELSAVQNTLMGAMEFNQRTIKATPTLFGESDIIKTLQLTPGVSSGTEGFANLYVRGGDTDGNLFLIDGNPVYQVNHVGGIFSAFNPEAIRNMEFFKAGFPARYGGRLSSVVDVHTREGNMREFHGSASLGLISGNLSLEGPLIKDRTSFQVALRRTWLDVLTAPTVAIANKIQKKQGYRMNFRYAFHDLNVKVNHRFSDRSRMYLSVYNGNDVLKGGSTDFSVPESTVAYSDGSNTSLRWGNLMATAGWTYVFNNRLFGKISGLFSQYRSKIGTTREYQYGKEGDKGYISTSAGTTSTTSILDMGIRSAFDYRPSLAHRVRFGGDFLFHRFHPEYNEVKIGSGGISNGSVDLGNAYTEDLLWGREVAAFIEDDWDVLPSLRLNGGLRFSLFNVERKTYALLEPRASLRWLLRDDLSFKSSYTRMGQYVHLLSNNYVDLPTDAWIPVTSQLKPLISDQVSVGFYYDWRKTYSFSIEGYYKWMKNLLEYKDGYSFLPGTASWEDKIASGKGRAYGLELLVRKESGRTTGWVGYTLSWSDRQFDKINRGRRFPSRYDNRHKLNIVVNHKLSEKVELTAAWTYTSGNRMTLSMQDYEGVSNDEHWEPNPYDPKKELSRINYYSGRNNYQLPAYHRLDLGLNIYRPKKKGRMGIWNISIYNVYSRMNPFMVYKSTYPVVTHNLIPGGYTEAHAVKQVPCFKQIGIMPIIPSVSYTYKF